jgi:hypothetical protein
MLKISFVQNHSFIFILQQKFLILERKKIVRGETFVDSSLISMTQHFVFLGKNEKKTFSKLEFNLFVCKKNYLNTCSKLLVLYKLYKLLGHPSY